jgi:hypothetical protein
MFPNIKLARPTVGNENMRPLTGIRMEKCDASRNMANRVAIPITNSDFGFAGFDSPALAADSLWPNQLISMILKQYHQPLSVKRIVINVDECCDCNCAGDYSPVVLRKADQRGHSSHGHGAHRHPAAVHGVLEKEFPAIE